jgi:hypothetical protein
MPKNQFGLPKSLILLVPRDAFTAYATVPLKVWKIVALVGDTI